MATKLAFKNLKSHLFKNHDAWNAGCSTNASSATESNSDGEISESALAKAMPENDVVKPLQQSVDAGTEDRSFCYLNSFERIFSEWDKDCISDHLEMIVGLNQLCADVAEPIGKICRATNQEHCFKSAFGTEALMPGHRYYFEIKCVKGNNFKIGIATEMAKKVPNSAFSDTDQGFAYFSTGSLRHASKGSGPIYGDKYR